MVRAVCYRYHHRGVECRGDLINNPKITSGNELFVAALRASIWLKSKTYVSRSNDSCAIENLIAFLVDKFIANRVNHAFAILSNFSVVQKSTFHPPKTEYMLLVPNR